jgi:hypothetical protein
MGGCNSCKNEVGHDFSRVRTHTDSEAVKSAQAVNALAYTVGQDVVFGLIVSWSTGGRVTRDERLGALCEPQLSAGCV